MSVPVYRSNRWHYSRPDWWGKVVSFLQSRRWFYVGQCYRCGRLGLYILRSERAHEDCWLASK